MTTLLLPNTPTAVSEIEKELAQIKLIAKKMSNPSKAAARKFLLKGGFITKAGHLSRRYR